MTNNGHRFLQLSLLGAAFVLTLGTLTGCSSNRQSARHAVPIQNNAAPAPGQAVEIRPAVFQEAPAPEPIGFATIYFDFDTSSIRRDQHDALNANARTLTRNSEVKIIVEGHCDERGTNEYNLMLGQRRADAVKTYLTDYGIVATRISVVSYGEERPVDRGQNEHAWERNRRCEFTTFQQ